MLLVKENLLCLFGGVKENEDQLKNLGGLTNELFLLDLQQNYWSKPIVGGYIPSPRIAFGFSGNQNETYGEIIVLGGKISDGNVEQSVYILHELDMDKREAWDERNDEEKNKFQAYKDAIKKDKKSDIAKVPTLNLEFNEAEQIIIDQKRQIGEKEREMKKVQDFNKAIVNKQLELQNRIDLVKSQLDDKMLTTKNEIGEFKGKSAQNQELIEKLKAINLLFDFQDLLVYERKKRKFYQKRANCLQEAFRKGENFIITIDQFYCRGIKEIKQIDDAFNGNVNDDILTKIEGLKQDHRGVLINFKREYEESYKREQHIRGELKQKQNVQKVSIKQFENISEILKGYLSKEEKEYLSKQQ